MDDAELRHGPDDAPVESTCPYGAVAWTLQWSHDTLVGARLRLPSGGHVRIAPRRETHLLLGPADQVTGDDGQRLTCFAAVDWRAPSALVPLWDPSRLPPGAGTAILNLIATLARHAGRTTLRYRGPYPTPALFDALRHSFDVGLDVDAAAARFSAQLERSLQRGTMIEVPVDFGPDPHQWAWPCDDVCTQWRRGLERVYIDGRAYGNAPSGRRLVPSPAGWTAVVEIAGRRFAEVASFDERGALSGGPHPLPPADPRFVGLALPPAVVEALAAAVASTLPAPLRAAAVAALGDHRVVFADTGAQLARQAADAIELHAELAAAMPEDSAQILALLGHAMVPIATRLATAHAMRAAAALNPTASPDRGARRGRQPAPSARSDGD